IVVEALEIFAITDRIKALASGTEPVVHEVRLGVFPTLSPYLLPYLLPQMRKAAPDIHFLVEDEKSGVLKEHLRKGELDVAILADDDFGPEMVQFPVLDEAFVLALPVEHPLARSYGS
ncbi:LysR substrate-binding domain-containing protein, partial [Pauljensenia sp. UMB0018B]|nr:LysR substrate-binding domain-containing protein [Pauljensenia sp. UMB0018B]